MVRRSGFGAEGRVKSILQKKGVSGVLDEVDQLEGDYVRRVYLQYLIANAPFNHATILPVLQRIRDHMSSDYDRRVLLTADRRENPARRTDGGRDLPVVGSMHSDYDRREVLNAVLQRRPLSPAVTQATIQAAGSMHSAFDKREVLAGMLSGSPSLTSDDKKTLLAAVTSIHSDYDAREVLVKFVQAYGVDEASRAPFFAAVDSIGGAYDRRMVSASSRKSGSAAQRRPVGVRFGGGDAIRLRSRRSADGVCQNTADRSSPASGVHGRGRQHPVFIRQGPRRSRRSPAPNAAEASCSAIFRCQARAWHRNIPPEYLKTDAKLQSRNRYILD